MIQIHQCFQKISPRNHFFTEIKGHNSDNNEWILSIIKLDLYFMIIYLFMKYESNTSMYSKDIARKPFFIERSRARTLIIIGGFYIIVSVSLRFLSNISTLYDIPSVFITIYDHTLVFISIMYDPT